MIKAKDAIAKARSLIGTPYAELDCINFIKKIIRTCPGGDSKYTTAGTNTLWKSFNSSGKYKDLTWRAESLDGAKAGMMAFKIDGSDVHHIGLVTGEGTVIHSSSANGGQGVVETNLNNGQWKALAIHKLIAVADSVSSASVSQKEENTLAAMETAIVRASPTLRIRVSPETGKIIGKIPDGSAVEILEDGEWPRVKYGRIVGYVKGSFLEYPRNAQDAHESVSNVISDQCTAADSDGPEWAQNDSDGVSYTTLINEDDGRAVMLVGNWRVADD